MDGEAADLAENCMELEHGEAADHAENGMDKDGEAAPDRAQNQVTQTSRNPQQLQQRKQKTPLPKYTAILPQPVSLGATPPVTARSRSAVFAEKQNG